MNLWAYLILTPPPPLALLIVSAISYIIEREGERPCESRFSMSLISTSSLAPRSFLLVGI
jgi:hypothetical protein